jgi:solute carrier family 44 (choline transporter-like protein), member 2/4/5
MFWGGMGYVGYEAITNGDPQRILYGLDSYGNYCGTLNKKADGQHIDLRKATKLLYTNPLELLDSNNYQYAHAVCVEQCPAISTVCNATSLPCRQSSQYVCPYYAYSQFGKNGSDELAIRDSKGLASTDWWGDLVNYQGVACVDSVFINSIPEEIRIAMNTSSSCGAYYQTTSMYPGEGPCAAVYFETTEFMHRCYPVIPDSAKGAIVSVGLSGLSVVPAARISVVWLPSFNHTRFTVLLGLSFLLVVHWLKEPCTQAMPTNLASNSMYRNCTKVFVIAKILGRFCVADH